MYNFQNIESFIIQVQKLKSQAERLKIESVNEIFTLRTYIPMGSSPIAINIFVISFNNELEKYVPSNLLQDIHCYDGNFDELFRTLTVQMYAIEHYIKLKKENKK